VTTSPGRRLWPYQRAAATLRDWIASGAAGPDGKLPSHADLAEQLGVATGTVERALAELKKEGLVESVPGMGTFVRKPPG